MASRKEYEMLFQLNAQMEGGFNSSFSKAKSEVASLQREVQQLSKVQADISAYQKQQQSIESTKSKLTTLQQQYDNIQREIKETEGFSSSLENKLLSKQQQIERTTDSLKRQEERLESMGTALKSAGVNTDNLTGASANLSTKIGELKSKQEDVSRSAQEMGTTTVGALEEMQAAIAALGIAQLYRSIFEEIKSCLAASIEYESALAGVYKTVDGTDDQLRQIDKDIKALSTNIPATTTEIAEVAEAAGQLGIATEDVMDFTRVMIDLGESTNLSAEEASSKLAKFANITKTQAENYSRLGSVVVDLGNNYATTEADIVAMGTRLASSATIAGFTEAEIFALAASMSSVGIEAEAGGTAMTQTLAEIEKAVAGGGDALESFADVAGMTADEFANSWKNSPVDALRAFISGLGGLEAKGESTVLVLSELGLTGIRQSNMLQSLGLAADTMGNAVETANKAWEENTALSAEAEKRYATTESQLAILNNSYKNLEVAIGDVFTPTLTGLAEMGSNVLDGMAEFVERNPELVKLIAALAIGVGAFVAALVVYIAVSKLAKAATTALTAALNSNPYLLAASAVLGVVVALVSFAATMSSAREEQERLTATAQKQQTELNKLTQEYELLCKQGKEASVEAQTLKLQIDSLETSLSSQCINLDEYLEKSRELSEQWKEATAENQDESKAIEVNSAHTQALINRLSELASQTNKTAASQEEMKVIVAELNDLLPNVSFSYDDIKNGLGEIEELLRQEEAVQTKLATIKTEREHMTEYGGNVDSAKHELEAMTEQLKTEKETNERIKSELQEGMDLYAEKYLNNEIDSELAANNERLSRELIKSDENIEKYSSRIDELNGDIKTLTADYNEALKKIIETSGMSIESVDALTEIDDAIATASLSMQALAAEYAVAYEAAQLSFEGQFGLFDEANANLEFTVSSAQSALDSQLMFWQTYANNISILKDVSAEDLGVTEENYNEIMAFAQSGTEEAAGFAQSLAEAIESGNEDAVKELVITYEKVKEARNIAAGEVASWQTEFQTQMDEIIDILEGKLTEMDMSDEAIEAATNMMTSYAETIAEEGESAVRKAISVSAAVTRALQSASSDVTITAVGKETVSVGPQPYNGGILNFTFSGYAGGTEKASRGPHWIGENGPELMWFDGGEHVLDAETSAALVKEHAKLAEVSFTPEFQSVLGAYNNATVEPLEARSSVGGNTYNINVSPQFTVENNGESLSDEKIQDLSERLISYFFEALEEAGIDATRRSYS